VLSDQSNPLDSKHLIEEVLATYGEIDVLFANAGVAQFAPSDQITEDFFDNQFNTNIKEPPLIVKEAMPNLSEGASIIFNTSIVHQKGFEGAGVYSAAKGALRSYARVLTSELAPRGIRVNSIAPGSIGTPIYSKMNGMTEEQVQEMGASFAQGVPLKRFGEVREIAGAAAFLASDDASYVNGIELEIDGEWARYNHFLITINKASQKKGFFVYTQLKSKKVEHEDTDWYLQWVLWKN